MRHIVLRSAALAALALLNVRLASAVERVEVATLSGRVLRGVVDARTDAARLWVRQEEGGVVLAASTAWDDVVQATLDGQPVAADSLRSRAGDSASSGPQSLADVEVLPPPSSTPVGITSTYRGTMVARARVRSVEIVNVCLVNLDRYVEPDGLQVSIAAIGDDGNPIAVRGSLIVRLTGELQRASVTAAEFGELERWSQPVAEADFVDGVATYNFRFRHTGPEWQFDLMPDAVLGVQLGAHGQGDYAAATPVVLRQFDPLRNHLQLLYGTRFMPRELHGRNPVSAPLRRDGRWIHWTW